MLPELKYELDYLAGILPELESYLLARDLYRTVHIHASRGFSHHPSLTPGTILLSLHKARSLATTTNDEGEVIKAEQRINHLRHKWQSAWEAKALLELQNRLTSWRTFLGELYSAPQENRDRYGYEVRQRVIIELLRDEITKIPDDLLLEIEKSDILLRELLKPTSFIWSEKLEQSFPPSRFWFLFRKP